MTLIKFRYHDVIYGNKLQKWAVQGHVSGRLRVQKDHLTLIGKFWKTYPEIFPKFQFPGCDTDGFLEN